MISYEPLFQTMKEKKSVLMNFLREGFNRKGMTQKQLGEILGFLGKTSDVCMAQYESETRVPKSDLVK